MSKESPRRSRGPRRRLSREKIIARTLELLQTMRAEELSMHKLARSLGVGTMTLYGYFDSREELLQAASEQILFSVDLESALALEDWPSALREWARAIRRVFVGNAEIVELVRSFTSVPYSWFELEAGLVSILKKAGLPAPVLQDTSRWAARMVMGSLLVELNMRRIAQASSEQQTTEHIYERLTPPARQLLDEWPTYLSEYFNHDENFAMMVERLIHLIEPLAQSSP